MTIQLPDLNNVEAWTGGGVLPPGKHVCRIDGAEEGQSSGGYPEIKIEWTAVGGEHAGMSVREWLVITQNNLGRLRAFLDAVGYQLPSGAFDLNVGSLVGRRATILVGQEPDRTNPQMMRSRVRAHEAASAAPGAPVPPPDWTQQIGSGRPASLMNPVDDIPF